MSDEFASVAPTQTLRAGPLIDPTLLAEIRRMRDTCAAILRLPPENMTARDTISASVRPRRAVMYYIFKYLGEKGYSKPERQAYIAACFLRDPLGALDAVISTQECIRNGDLEVILWLREFSVRFNTDALPWILEIAAAHADTPSSSR